MLHIDVLIAVLENEFINEAVIDIFIFPKHAKELWDRLCSILSIVTKLLSRWLLKLSYVRQYQFLEGLLGSHILRRCWLIGLFQGLILEKFQIILQCQHVVIIRIELVRDGLLDHFLEKFRERWPDLGLHGNLFLQITDILEDCLGSTRFSSKANTSMQLSRIKVL